jgi:hypothetical protein
MSLIKLNNEKDGYGCSIWAYKTNYIEILITLYFFIYFYNKKKINLKKIFI